jgi:hypothetical protein
MNRRWAMTNKKDGLHIEVAYCVLGKQFLQGVRKSYPDLFRGCRIVDIFQAKPSEIQIGVIYYSKDGKWVEGSGPGQLHKPFPKSPSGILVPDFSKHNTE